MSAQERREREIRAYLKEIGDCPSVRTFVEQYTNFNTRANYLQQLMLYLRWLRAAQGVTMTPDELVYDNLACIGRSDPLDVLSKSKHTRWLQTYLNSHLVERHASESVREMSNTVVRRFYACNNSQLWGWLKKSRLRRGRRPKVPDAEDIRKVLVAMDQRMRTPLLLSWQSSVEINRVIEMDWSFAAGQPSPCKVELVGRKANLDLEYFTFVGRDSLQHLAALGPEGMPGYDSVLHNMKEAAIKLIQAGQLKFTDLRSWTPHKLRHSFKTEAEAIRPKLETNIIEAFMGHKAGISWVYDHRSELHPGLFVETYEAIERVCCLNPGEAVVKQSYEEKEKTLGRRIASLEARLESLLRASSAIPGLPPEEPRAPPAER